MKSYRATAFCRCRYGIMDSFRTHMGIETATHEMVTPSSIRSNSFVNDDSPQTKEQTRYINTFNMIGQ